MGNSTSTGGQGRSNHDRHSHHGRSGWSHSLETPEQRNRMKRGYFPPRPYVGQPGLPQPQKVLPSVVNPNKILKSTSNGAILHGGGTISGRKLSEMELDMRKRSTASCPANGDGPSSGRSTPNLMRTRKGGGSSKGSSRDYDSEPDLRDVGMDPDSSATADVHGNHSPENRSVSPLPNSFTLISESPAKKQIRSRKKSKAPPPPPGQSHHHDPMMINVIPYNINGHHNNNISQPYPHPQQFQLLQQNQQRQLLLTPVQIDGSQGKKKLNRLFKTKAESKSAAASPALRSPAGSELIVTPTNSQNQLQQYPLHHPLQQQQQQMMIQVSRGGPMRASLDANRLIRGERERMSHHSVEGSLHNNNISSSSSHPIDRESKAKDELNRKSVVKNHPSRLGLEGPLCSPKGGSSSKVEVTNLSNKKPSTSSTTTTTTGSHALSHHHPQQSAVPSSRDAAVAPSSGLRQVPKNNCKTEEKTNSPSINNVKNNSSKSANQTPLGLNKQTTTSGNKIVNSNITVDDEWENGDKKTFYFGMDMGTFSSAQKLKNHQQKQSKHDDTLDTRRTESPSGDLHKEISRRKMLKQMEEFESSSKSGGGRSSSRAEEDNVGQSSSRNSTPTTTTAAHSHHAITNNKLQTGVSNKAISEEENGTHHVNKSHNNNMNHLNRGKIALNGQNNNASGKTGLAKSNSNNINRSESDSDGLHRRQDSGSFDLNDGRKGGGRHTSSNNNKISSSNNKNNNNNGVIRESSSDLSSSDLDVPLVVTRPTLPQKRPDLPRFSPTAAWRALDSPSRVSISGRSFSSEEGLGIDRTGGIDRIQRYTRPSAPPRVSHERSGDSGISAGDAGSPANPLPCETIDLSPLMISNGGGGGGRNSRKPRKGVNSSNTKDILSADRMMKCWTPQQDLDESSSDFEHDTIIPPTGSKLQSPPNTNSSGPGSPNACKIVPVGVRTPPKFTTRSNLFEGKRAAAVVSDSDSKYYSSGAGGGGIGDEIHSNNNNNRRFYSRSTKSKQHQQKQQQGVVIGAVEIGNPSKKRFSNSNYPQQQQQQPSQQHNPSVTKYPGKYSNSNNIISKGRRAFKHHIGSNNGSSGVNNNGFVGLDTNWFLSRSEPNSLHVLGISSSDDNTRFGTDEEFHQFRRQRDAQLLAKVFPPRKSSSSSKPSVRPNPPTPNSKHKQPQQPSIEMREVIVGRSRKEMMPKNEQDNDEFECELHLEDEEEESCSGSDNNNKTTTNAINSRRINNISSTSKITTTNGISNIIRRTEQVRSEIGYGPSSMNFYSPQLPQKPFYDNYEDQEERIEVQPEDDDDDDEVEEELMRDDLFDYLDQYEEGEFEREQELTTSDNNISSNNKNGNTFTSATTNQTKDKSSNNNSSKAFSHHIMYLPSYDSRRINHPNSSNNYWRRARSVDHLDSSEITLFRRPNNSSNKTVQQNSSSGPNERYLDFEIESEDNQGYHRKQLQQQNRNFNVSSNQQQQQSTKPMRKTSEPCYLNQRAQLIAEDQEGQRVLAVDTADELAEQERRLMNKKKFKFQSTLRVQERKKIEQELTREARQREDERLREIEAMKKVEEEFQKKRAKEKLEAQAASALANLNGQHELISTNCNSRNISQGDIIMSSAKGMMMSPPLRKTSSNNLSSSGGGVRSTNTNVLLSHQPSSSSSAGGSSGSGISNGGHQHHQYNYNNNEQHNQFHNSNRGGGGMMSKRQEPEGAPASASVNSLCNSPSNNNIDLRKELITASKKRSGNLVRGSSQELTHELSEMRQETRQYCDYRRGPRQQSLSPARFAQSSSSDIFPISSRRKGGSNYSGGSKNSGMSTVHPEVVCDIPVKPHPYMINASRLSGSAMNLVSEERPNSGLGSANNLSSPSSVISDNYRKDWAHHYRGLGGSIIQGGRASSVISLHSAPGYSSSDNFRNSTSDLTRVHIHHLNGPPGNVSPRFLRERGSRLLARQYSTSPPSTSPVPPRGISSNESTATESIHPMDDKCSSRASPVRISSRSNTTVISIGPHMSHNIPHSDPAGIFHAQPYNKVKGYRPVSFKPSAASTTTAVN